MCHEQRRPQTGVEGHGGTLGCEAIEPVSCGRDVSIRQFAIWTGAWPSRVTSLGGIKTPGVIMSAAVISSAAFWSAVLGSAFGPAVASCYRAVLLALGVMLVMQLRSSSAPDPAGE